MECCDKLTLNLKDNPEWAAALAGASAGDTITLKEVTVMIDEISTDTVTASVEECEDMKVTPGPDAKEDDEDTEAKADDIISVMSAGYKK